MADETRSRLIQKRVDRGQCAAALGGGPQFVSEKYYGPEDTTGTIYTIDVQCICHAVLVVGCVHTFG